MKLRLSVFRKKENVLVFLSIATTFCYAPFIFLYLYRTHYLLVSSILSLLVFLSVCLVSRINKQDLQWMIVWSLLFVSWFVFAFVHDLTKSSQYEYRAVIGFLIKLSYLFGTTILIKRNYGLFLNAFTGIHYFIIAMSIGLFVLLLIGLPIPHYDFETAGETGCIYSFYYVGSTNTVINYGQQAFIRIAGYADEPGALALIITYLLILNEVTFESKRRRQFLILSGILTFSLAFAVSCFMFVIYRFGLNRNSLKYIAATSLIGVVVFFGYKNMPESSLKQFVDAFCISRFQYNEDTGTFVGDNRQLVKSMSNIGAVMGDDLFMGYGNENGLDILSGEGFYIASVAGFIACNGLYGLALFYLPFYFLIVKKANKPRLVFLLMILFVNYLQRPGITDPFAMVCLSLIYYSNKYQTCSIPQVRGQAYPLVLKSI